jgi:predicted histidine transporter YuiF (NhaC family)
MLLLLVVTLLMMMGIRNAAITITSCIHVQHPLSSITSFAFVVVVAVFCLLAGRCDRGASAREREREATMKW